ncbi:unnamed protein product [Amoebophrya sp. A25]|nr:unnamed protein product [Amoebophrya sp. A25]|eukprot:GSA25T00020233001.1
MVPLPPPTIRLPCSGVAFALLAALLALSARAAQWNNSCPPLFLARDYERGLASSSTHTANISPAGDAQQGVSDLDASTSPGSEGDRHHRDHEDDCNDEDVEDRTADVEDVEFQHASPVVSLVEEKDLDDRMENRKYLQVLRDDHQASPCCNDDRMKKRKYQDLLAFCNLGRTISQEDRHSGKHARQREAVTHSSATAVSGGPEHHQAVDTLNRFDFSSATSSWSDGLGGPVTGRGGGNAEAVEWPPDLDAARLLLGSRGLWCCSPAVCDSQLCRLTNSNLCVCCSTTETESGSCEEYLQSISCYSSSAPTEVELLQSICIPNTRIEDGDQLPRIVDALELDAMINGDGHHWTSISFEGRHGHHGHHWTSTSRTSSTSDRSATTSMGAVCDGDQLALEEITEKGGIGDKKLRIKDEAASRPSLFPHLQVHVLPSHQVQLPTTSSAGAASSSLGQKSFLARGSAGGASTTTSSPTRSGAPHRVQLHQSYRGEVRGVGPPWIDSLFAGQDSIDCEMIRRLMTREELQARSTFAVTSQIHERDNGGCSLHFHRAVWRELAGVPHRLAGFHKVPGAAASSVLCPTPRRPILPIFQKNPPRKSDLELP